MDSDSYKYCNHYVSQFTSNNFNVVGEGLITLSVTIDGICGIPSLITTKQIAVGTLTNPTILDENGHETFGVTACLDDRRHVCMDIDPAWGVVEDRKSTRLNSNHVAIS